MSKAKSIKSVVIDLHTEVQDKRNHRLKSWEHCYKFFQAERDKKEKNLDLAALNLAFYLASMGMYRGSSFLLNLDYKVHLPIVKELFDERWIKLNCVSLNGATENIDDLLTLMSKLKSHYRATSDGKGVTDTLITKVLMGTLACLPAFDRYFLKGLRNSDIEVSVFNRNNLEICLGHFQTEPCKFEPVRQTLSTDTLNYPVMRIVDMYYWKQGGGRSK